MTIRTNTNPEQSEESREISQPGTQVIVELCFDGVPEEVVEWLNGVPAGRCFMCDEYIGADTTCDGFN
jgi:hypothetical protein